MLRFILSLMLAAVMSLGLSSPVMASGNMNSAKPIGALPITYEENHVQQTMVYNPAYDAYTAKGGPSDPDWTAFDTAWAKARKIFSSGQERAPYLEQAKIMNDLYEPLCKKYGPCKVRSR